MFDIKTGSITYSQNNITIRTKKQKLPAKTLVDGQCCKKQYKSKV